MSSRVVVATLVSALVSTPWTVAGAAPAGAHDPIPRVPDRSQVAKSYPWGRPAPLGDARVAAPPRVGMLAVEPTVDLQPCPEDPAWLCGTVPVPFDRARPNGRQLDIAIAVLPHSDPTSTATDAVFANTGGPGFSNLVDRGFLASVLGGLTDQRDVVVVDHRGTGQSGAIDCPRLAQTLGNPAVAAPAMIRAIGRCGRRLGDDADRYGSGDVALDLDTIRAALGYEQVSLYGLSYAGALVSAYATRFPDRVRAAVVDGGVPTIDPGHKWLWGEDNPSALAGIVALHCRRAPACRAAQPGAGTALARVASAVRAVPVRGTVSVSNLGRRRVTVDERMLLRLISNFLNQAEFAPVAEALGRGDPRPLLREAGETELNQFVVDPPEVFSVGDNVATACNDQDFVWQRTDPVPVRRAKYRAALRRLGPGHFAPFSQPAWSEYWLTDLCLRWPAPDRYVPAVRRGATATGMPVLILSGDFDEVVPTRTTRELLRVFPDATFKVVAGAGHVPGSWSGCAREQIAELLGTLESTIECDQPYNSILTVPSFPRLTRHATAALPAPGDQSTRRDRQVATVVVHTGVDALLRSFRVPDAIGGLAGLRGGEGGFDYSAEDQATFTLDRMRFSADTATTGDMTWRFADVQLSLTVTVDGPGDHDGTLTAVGNTQIDDLPYQDFVVTGTLGGRNVRVTVPAN